VIIYVDYVDSWMLTHAAVAVKQGRGAAAGLL
jgi:hypothetical protein